MLNAKEYRVKESLLTLIFSLSFVALASNMDNKHKLEAQQNGARPKLAVQSLFPQGKKLLPSINGPVQQALDKLPDSSHANTNDKLLVSDATTIINFAPQKRLRASSRIVTLKDDLPKSKRTKEAIIFNRSKLSPIVEETEFLLTSALADAIEQKQPNKFKMLLEAGANPKLIVTTIIANDDPAYIAMALDRSGSKRLNPDMMIKDSEGIDRPLLFWTMDKSKPLHFLQLLKHGANANIRDGKGTLIAFNAVFDDDWQYIRMLLENGLNPHEIVSSQDRSASLTYFAWLWNKPVHKQLLEARGGTCCSCVIL